MINIVSGRPPLKQYGVDVDKMPDGVVGFQIPAYDQQVIDEADPNNVTITYKKNGATVATKTIAISGTTTTITVT